MNSEIKTRVLFLYGLLGMVLAAGIALGVAALVSKPSKHEVNALIQKAVGDSSNSAAIAVCEAGVQNAAVQNSLVIVKWLEAKYVGVVNGKTLVDVRAVVGDGYGDIQQPPYHLECSLTKGVYQVSGITAKK